MVRRGFVELVLGWSAAAAALARSVQLELGTDPLPAQMQGHMLTDEVD